MEEMLPAILKSIGKKGNINNTVLAVGAVSAIGLAGAGVAVSQFIKRGHDQASTQEEAKKAELGMEQLRRKFIYDNGNREWKIIDCASGKKCIVPEAQSTYTPTPLTDSTGKITVSGAAGLQRIAVRVPVVGNLNESQVDTFFGTPSSAPPPEIDSQTNPGILNSRVIFTLDTATQPQIGRPGELIIQTVVTKADNSEVPGPPGKVELAALPPPPTCTVAASRNGNTGNCTVTVTPSGAFSGSPSISSVSLTQSGTNWSSSSASCSLNSTTNFTATISGSGGSNTCSAAVDAILPPTCTVAASRNGNSGNCTVTVTPSGNATSASLTAPTWLVLSSSGSQYTSSSVACSTTSTTAFTASITGPGGIQACNNTVSIPPLAPTCTIAASRNGNSGNCTVTVTPSGNATSASLTAPTSLALSSSGSQYTSSSIVCSTTSTTTFAADITGPGGTQACSNTAFVNKIDPPTCTIAASRNSNYVTCTLNLTTGGVLNSPPSNPSFQRASAGESFSPFTPNSPLWNSSTTFTATADCPGTQNLTFRAFVEGPGGTSSPCTSQTVSSVPGPTCSLSAVRNSSNPARCDVSVTVNSGTATSASVSPSVTLSQSGSNWSGQTDCLTTQSYTFSATVNGPGTTSAVSCFNQAIVPAFSPCGEGAPVQNFRQNLVFSAETTGCTWELPRSNYKNNAVKRLAGNFNLPPSARTLCELTITTFDTVRKSNAGQRLWEYDDFAVLTFGRQDALGSGYIIGSSAFDKADLTGVFGLEEKKPNRIWFEKSKFLGKSWPAEKRRRDYPPTSPNYCNGCEGASAASCRNNQNSGVPYNCLYNRYCPEGTSCTLPRSKAAGDVSITVPSDWFRGLPTEFLSLTPFNFDVSIWLNGDNDSSDCKHSGITLEVTAKYSNY